MRIIENLDEYFNNKTISVVCNGKSLIDNDYSKEIDSSDIVIRINLGSVEFSKYPNLGKKINIFATNVYVDHNFKKISDYLKNLDNDIDIMTTRPFFNNKKTNCAIANYEFIKIFKYLNKNIIEIKEEVLLNNSYNGFNNFSSGLSIVLFLKDFNFKELKIFGMDFFKSDYYYNSKIPINPHDSKIEEILIKKLLNSNLNIKKY